MDIGLPVGVDAGLSSYEPVSGARRTDVPNPDVTAPSIPDTGIIPPAFQLDFIVDEKVANSKQMAKIQRWMLQDKETDDFLKGRFGIRYDAKDYMDIVPVGGASPSGLKLVHFQFLDDIGWGGLVVCRATLQFGGNPTAWVTALQAFIDA